MPNLEDARTMQPLTGAAVASDDLFYVFDASTNLPKTLTKAEMQTAATAAIPADPADEATFDGEPVTYVATVAATAMSETYTVGSNKTVTLTAKTLGVLSPAPKLVVTASAAANQALAIMSQAAGVVTVRPATGPGDKAVCEYGANNAKLTITFPTAGPAGNTPTLAVQNMPSGEVLTVEYNNLTSLFIGLAMDTGTAAATVMTDAGTGATSAITVTAPTGVAIDPTGYDDVTFEVAVHDTYPTAFSVDASAWPAVVINLGTDANGDVIPLAADDLAAAMELAEDGVYYGPGWTWDAGVNVGVYNSANPPITMATPGVAPAPLTDGSNSATNVAAAIELATDFTAAAGGTGADDVAVGTDTFAGGGANAAITSTLADLTTLLHAAPSTIIDCTAGAGLQTTVLEATAGVTLTGGSNVVAATIGTPAVKLGRLAIGLADPGHTTKSIWTAVFADPTGTNAGTWVKTYTGS